MPSTRPSGTAAALALSAALLLTLRAPAAAQDASPVIRNPSPLRISVELVQVDATVFDDNGKPVRDLEAADFEVLQDGRPQKISAFQYVPTGGTVRALGPIAAKPADTSLSPTLVTRDAVRRTIAIVVDDLALSFESIGRVRTALRRFIDTQMQPGDLVAILRTGAGMGALQQFTTDKRLLHAAADRVQWNRVASMTSFAATDTDARLNGIQKEFFAAGTLGAVLYVLRGVSQLPGRKSLLLLSDGFRLTDSDASYGRIFSMVQSVADLANRAGVVVHGIDLRGLGADAPSATEAGASPPGQTVARLRSERTTNETGPDMLANETGGLFIHNVNDIAVGVQRVLDEDQGFYLLGYVPEGSTFAAKNPKYHDLTVRVNRPGLRVRSRKGFLGRADPSDALSADRMLAAVTSPFAGGDIHLRLSSFFGRSRDAGSVVQSMMHVDPHDLTFTEGADGTRVAQLEVLAMTFGENGTVADQLRRRYTVRFTPDRFAIALQHGFVYNLRLPVKRPGPYQLRIALRDAGADRIGSANQFVDVPDLNRHQLTLSGLFIQGLGAGGTSDGAVEAGDPNSTIAVRRFRRGIQAAYTCYAYNVAGDSSGKPQVEFELRLFRDGVEVLRSGAQPAAASPDPSEVAIAGLLPIGPSMTPGNYVLEITVTDRLAKKNRRASQLIDFEVIE